MQTLSPSQLEEGASVPKQLELSGLSHQDTVVTISRVVFHSLTKLSFCLSFRCLFLVPFSPQTLGILTWSVGVWGLHLIRSFDKDAIQLPPCTVLPAHTSLRRRTYAGSRIAHNTWTRPLKTAQCRSRRAATGAGAARPPPRMTTTTTTTPTTTVTVPRRGSGRGCVSPVWSAAGGSCPVTGSSPVPGVSSLESPTGASTKPGPASPPLTSSAWPRRPSRPSTPVCPSPLAVASLPSRLLSSAGTRPARWTASAAWSSRWASSRASSPSGPRL